MYSLFNFTLLTPCTNISLWKVMILLQNHYDSKHILHLSTKMTYLNNFVYYKKPIAFFLHLSHSTRVAISMILASWQGSCKILQKYYCNGKTTFNGFGESKLLKDYLQKLTEQYDSCLDYAICNEKKPTRKKIIYFRSRQINGVVL